MQKEVLFPLSTTLGVVELVENKPTLGHSCLDMSVILFEANLVPGLFSFLTQSFLTGTLLPLRGHLVLRTKSPDYYRVDENLILNFLAVRVNSKLA